MTTPIFDLTLSFLQAQFRFSWLESKMSEEVDLGKTSTTNRYIFKGLPNSVCCPNAMSNLLGEMASLPEAASFLDGLLFYHKLGFYTPGRTPLVGWLKPFMLPEILNVPVPDLYELKKPVGYVNIQQHISKTPKTERANDSPMDVVSSTQ